MKRIFMSVLSRGRKSNRSLVFVLSTLAIGASTFFSEEKAYGFDVKTCFVSEVKNHQPLVIEEPAGNRFEISNGRLWAYTALNTANSRGKIVHLWRLKSGVTVDKITRPTLYGLRMYSYKNISDANVGQWELQTLDEAGSILDSVRFDILKDHETFSVKAESGNAFDCTVADAERVSNSAAENKPESANSPSPLSETSPVSEDAKAFVVEDQDSKHLWRVGAGVGIAVPTGRMHDYLDRSQAAQVFVARKIDALTFQNYLSLNASFAKFRGHSGEQENSARDFNLSANLNAFFPLTRRFRLLGGLGVGLSTWQAKAETSGTLLTSNRGSDPSLEIFTGADLKLGSSVSALLEIRMRKTFFEFDETYIPVTLGLAYDFGSNK
ncbi:MAG: DUF2914 domain-containing protein [Proteobacteria bacterium]|nr:MAG: DUF2914 domain-containing protein [Pseudomonadota bacterium]